MRGFIILLTLASSACAITAKRPVQEMSNTSAAMKAARELKADVLAPELFRQAKEWFSKARREYRFKNFMEAKIYATRARTFAERAEFEARMNGAGTETAPPDPLADPEATEAADSAEANPNPNEYEKAPSYSVEEAERLQKQQAQGPPAAAPTPTPPNAGQ